MYRLLFPDHLISQLQKSNIHYCKNQQIQRHYSYPYRLLHVTEDHWHKGASNIRRCHLKSDNSSTISFAEISRSHVLDCGINGSHSCSDDYKANCCNKTTLGMMAEDIGVSKYVLSRIFSKTFHRNFNQYLNDERLNYAIMCLEHSDLSITQICMDSGFDSQRTFNRVFKERYKVAPREYRKGRIE